MEHKYYVESIDAWVDENQTKVIKKAMTRKIKNETITIKDAKVRVYIPTNEEIYDRYTDSQTQKRFFNIYAKQNHLLTGDEIIDIRHQLKLSQRGFANLLGLSKATIEHYENGTLPNRSNSILIALISQMPHEKLKQLFNETDQSNFSKNDKLNYQVQSI